MSEEMFTHHNRVANGLRKLPGHIECLASRLIAIAKLSGSGSTVECHYGAITLHVREDMTVDQIRKDYERKAMERNVWPRLRQLQPA